MPKKPLISIHDITTNETTTREMTDAEFEQHKIDLANWAAAEEARVAKFAARESAFAKLGLTAEEIAAI